MSVRPSQGGKTICAFIYGLIPEEIDDLLRRLQSCSQFYEFHSLVPTILLEFRVEVATRNSASAFEKIQDIERETGLNPQWNFDPREIPSGPINMLQLDYGQITLDLTALTARLSHYIFICNVHLEMPAILDKINQRVVDVVTSPTHKTALQHCELQLRIRNTHMSAYLKGTLTKIEQLLIRVQAQRDIVSDLDFVVVD